MIGNNYQTLYPVKNKFQEWDPNNLGRKKVTPDGIPEMQKEIKSKESDKYVSKSEQILAV